MTEFHQRPFFIRVLVPTGDPDGLRIVEKSWKNSDGKTLKQLQAAVTTESE